MPGFSLTLLLLPSSSSTAAPSEDVILRLLDASTSAPGWKWTSCAPPSEMPPPPAALTSERAADRAMKVRAQDVQGFVLAVERACNALDKAEPDITRMDTISGDGDCGLTLQTGAHGIQSREIPPSFTRADRAPSCTRTSPRRLGQRRRCHWSPYRCVRSGGRKDGWHQRRAVLVSSPDARSTVIVIDMGTTAVASSFRRLPRRSLPRVLVWSPCTIGLAPSL